MNLLDASSMPCLRICHGIEHAQSEVAERRVVLLACPAQDRTRAHPRIRLEDIGKTIERSSR
jgi:uncharacterized Zn-finger protein